MERRGINSDYTTVELFVQNDLFTLLHVHQCFYFSSWAKSNVSVFIKSKYDGSISPLEQVNVSVFIKSKYDKYFFNNVNHDEGRYVNLQE